MSDDREVKRRFKKRYVFLGALLLLFVYQMGRSSVQQPVPLLGDRDLPGDSRPKVVETTDGVVKPKPKRVPKENPFGSLPLGVPDRVPGNVGTGVDESSSERFRFKDIDVPSGYAPKIERLSSSQPLSPLRSVEESASASRVLTPSFSPVRITYSTDCDCDK